MARCSPGSTVSTIRIFSSALSLSAKSKPASSTREQDPAKAEALEAWLEQVADTYNVLSMDARAFRCWAKLMHRRPDPLIGDAMIAAVAVVHKLVVVKRNVRDFETLGVTVFNPLQAEK